MPRHPPERMLSSRADPGRSHRSRALPLPGHARTILGVLLPTLDVETIRWVDGIPRAFRVGQTAITLGAWSFRRLADVHFAPGRFDPSTCTALSVIVHEAAHVWQVSSMGGGRGVWLLRLFYLRYVSSWIRNGFRYDRIRYEREAFSLQRRFLEAASRVAAARPDLPRGADGLPDPSHPEFPAALALEWSKLVPFREPEAVPM